MEKEPKKKTGKVNWIFIIGVLCLVVMCSRIMSETSDERTAQQAVEKERKERHCRVKWDSLSEPEKRIYLNEFIQERGMGWSLSKIAIQSMEQGSKYPESILFEGKKIGDFILIKPEWGRISNAEEGIITYTIPFTAENAFRQTVRANLDLKIRYTAGCKAPTKVSSQVFER